MTRRRAFGLLIVGPALVLLASVTTGVATVDGTLRLASIVIGIAAAALLMWGVFYLLRFNARD